MDAELEEQVEMPSGTPIHVVATTLVGTRDALAAALAVAAATDSRVYVIARSGVSGGGSAAQIADAARARADDIRRLPGASSPRVDVLAVVSRQSTDLLPLLPPRALVFVGGQSGRWWPSAEQRTAHAFTRLGCRVVFVHPLMA
jgi:hypothetical protein